MRKIHTLTQGSPEWHAHRNTPGIINGSEIAAIFGVSSYTTRSELVRQKATGIVPEVDAAKQKRFDLGHLYEALFRPVAESTIDDDLSAMVMSDEIDGVALSVSLDGITQGYDTTLEHKTLNANLAAALEAGDIPEEYHFQIEAGLMVSGAKRSLFAASKWEPAPGDEVDPGRVYQFVHDEEGNMARWALVDAKHAWYESRPELRPRIIAACKQFLEDVKNYVHVEEAPKPVAAVIEALPALIVQVEGKVLSTNLDAFKAKAGAFIESIKTELSTDQDFADAEQMVKFLKDGEDKLDLAKQQALAQTATIDEVFRTVDAISAQMRSKRLALDKLVKAEKDARKAEIVTDARRALEDHITALNARIGGNWLPMASVQPFAEAIKGKKTLTSMRNEVFTTLAAEKIRFNAIADRFEFNRNAVITAVMANTPPETEWAQIFPDMPLIVLKDPDDLALLVKSRIDAYNTALENERARTAAAQAIEDARKSTEAAVHETASLESAANDQRENAAEATHAQPQATEAPQAPAASIPPFPGAISDDAIISDFLALLPHSPSEKKALRSMLEKFVKYAHARMNIALKEAA